jgi:hypothetical protein
LSKKDKAVIVEAAKHPIGKCEKNQVSPESGEGLLFRCKKAPLQIFSGEPAPILRMRVSTDN